MGPETNQDKAPSNTDPLIQLNGELNRLGIKTKIVVEMQGTEPRPKIGAEYQTKTGRTLILEITANGMEPELQYRLDAQFGGNAREVSGNDLSQFFMGAMSDSTGGFIVSDPDNGITLQSNNAPSHITITPSEDNPAIGTITQSNKPLDEN